VTVTDVPSATSREGIADYHFLRELGAGNHGVFYLARRPERLPVDADVVAVKVLSSTSAQDTFRRAVRELAAFAAVRSPYLVTLYDAGQQGRDLYYSMEYLAGGSLASPATPVQRRAVLAAVAHAARAAHALHEAGIAHNDIKPGNVLLHPGGGKLADLGLSQVLMPGATLTGLGPTACVEYLDPALIRGGAPSRASDVYALGATLHRALTGAGMYGDLPDGNPMVAVRHVMSRPATISAGLDSATRAIISSAIRHGNGTEPVNALDLARRIEALDRA
jgi:serine/threonine protein kinase